MKIDSEETRPTSLDGLPNSHERLSRVLLGGICRSYAARIEPDVKVNGCVKDRERQRDAR